MGYIVVVNIHPIRSFLPAVFIIVGLAACGGGDTAASPPAPVSGAPVSGAPASGTAVSGSPASGAPVSAPPASGGAGSTAGTPSGSASLSWLPPVENTDGTPIANLAGYHIYRGASADNLNIVATIGNPGATAHVVDSLPPGTHYFAISAYTSSGTEGDRSPVASKTIP